ncbi:MAG: activase [Chitinivibrionales bacterium]|nr:activase [Chitinivibrionales bacterium]MBD3397115.1 activase [Chitinivibrionales bacterium]
MKTLGICFGATTIQCVELHADPQFKAVAKSERIPHEGNTRRALAGLLSRTNLEGIDRIAVTGRSFRSKVCFSSISEAEAVERALREACGDGPYPDVVLSLGGETQFVYRIASGGGIESVRSGSKCASGTGEFFLQQVRRMGLSLDEAVSLAREGSPHRIAGRCSVFCKSDCTHALNKGEPVGNIAAGLCTMMADKVSELIKDESCGSVMAIGGGALNSALMAILRERYPRVTVVEQAAVFEAYGAALWAADNPVAPAPEDIRDVVVHDGCSFDVHPPLAGFRDMVTFREWDRGRAGSGDTCVLGLDVGSTTTKAALVRTRDRCMLASVYLRTNGDPIDASRRCYADIARQIGETAVEVIGLGVTGSGRQIAGLHALSTTIINEIVAHAAAAAYFDDSVDTIFEIGGQDAKYTCLTGGVASDYAMNEACSAGTGSFLEESALESLNVPMEQIGERALNGTAPPNFTDQCAAFISSDIKRAGQEGIAHDDILAGLVYSICMNYLNRVKGNRPVGQHVFMQGGVCYNRAVPVAMASLLQAPVVVPPDPGLMGAFGVALEVAGRIESGAVKRSEFDLKELAARDAVREDSFVCAGGRERCDRKCEIARFRIGGTVYPFGGMCDRYYNMRVRKDIDAGELDLVAVRQKLMFDTYGPAAPEPGFPAGFRHRRRTVGVNLSFSTHSLFPLYANFFTRLGFEVVLPDAVDPGGLSRIEAAFCFPAEISHGAFCSLLKKKCDYLFVPQVSLLPVPNVPTYSRSCPLVQGEPYYLKSTFRSDIERAKTTVLCPVLKMQDGYEQALDAFVSMAGALGVPERDANNAFLFACARQQAFENELRREGRKALHYLEKHPDRFGAVLFGRPYNAFARESNANVPHKIASRGCMVIPHDMLPADDYRVDGKMFWAHGQRIMKAAQFVRDRQNLFGVYVTNFSCGPDSFLLGYFRNVMHRKPSLTIELDQHTADAGIDTRIDAALDIMGHYRAMTGAPPSAEKAFRRARVAFEGIPYVYASDGRKYALNDPRVEVVFPSMGVYHSQAGAAALRGTGIDARAVRLPDSSVLLKGRKNTSCKECLPYQVIVGSFLDYLDRKKDPDKVTLFFLATGGGPCRLGQYFRAFEQVLERKQIPNAAVLTLTDENGYAGLGRRALLRGWQGIVAADVFRDIKSFVSVAAKDPGAAHQKLDSAWREVLAYLEGRLSVRFTKLLAWISRRLSSIEVTRALHEVPAVSLVGEIFVRSDEFSRNGIVEFLEGQGFMVRVGPIGEYPCYGNYVVNSGLGERRFSLKELVKIRLTSRIQEWWERRIKTALAASGLYRFEMMDVSETIHGVRHLISDEFRGECILTVGLGMREILRDTCGVVSIGPFGCMHSRMAEAILKREMNVPGKSRMPGWSHRVKALVPTDAESLPFLAIETDGNPFPQIIDANCEAFVLQARRMFERLHAVRSRDDTAGTMSRLAGVGTRLAGVVAE